MTSRAGFHHSEVMLLALVRGRGGEERVGKQSGWQQVWARCGGWRRKQLGPAGGETSTWIPSIMLCDLSQVLAHSGSLWAAWVFGAVPETRSYWSLHVQGKNLGAVLVIPGDMAVCG